MKIIVAITAASGAIYARQLLEELVRSEQVTEIALIESDNAAAVAEWEEVQMPQSEKITRYANNSMFAAVASGSARFDAMAVVPCTVGTLGRVASGISQTLIERAVDVMLKERRKLVLLVRESPLSLIHLRNMTTLTEAGAIVMPASPSFYSRPESIESLCHTLIERVLVHLGIETSHYEWGSEGNKNG